MTPGRATTLTLAFFVVVSCGCRRENPKPVPKEFEFGARRVQLIVPEGWEALDQGREKRFRKGDSEIVLQYVIAGPTTPSRRESDAVFDLALDALSAGVGHDQQREIKSRREVSIDGRSGTDIETWSRLDHGNPQRFLLIRDGDDLLALRTERMAFADTLAAFDAIRDSLHFIGVRAPESPSP